MKKICFIAQFPPPIHGLCKAVDTLYKSELSTEFEFEKVNLTNNKQFLKNLYDIFKSKADLFYFTISQSKGGNLRDLLIFKLLSLQKKKCVIHLHGGYYRKLVENDLGELQRKANYSAIKKVAGAIVLGTSLKSIFKGMVADEKIFVVPNCVEDSFLMSDDAFLKKNVTTDERNVKHVLYLSNLIKSKGYPEVLKLAKMEKTRCENGGDKKYHFDFAGRFYNSLDEKFFFEYINNNGLDDYITFHGLVDGEKKQKLLYNSDFFILLTRYPNEGQPISILEAMANGLVVITTDHAGIPDIVEDGKNGIVLSENETIENLLYAMNEIDVKTTALLNRNVVLTKYKEEIYINNMRKCFYSIFESN